METLPSGTLLHDRYRIERALGSGGFGHVYLSVDIQTNVQYAIKEYLLSGASGQAQLQHEARVLSQLHHPNLPAFQEAFNERGRYFVALGYIEGNDLTDYIRMIRTRNEVIPLDRLMTWILSICDAVQFLHSQTPPVIHRDIKPDNIRIKPDGTAILVDLGNAKAIADGSRTLFFIRHQGTPGYAPLEQYPGGGGTDARSDVYALGGTLFFALTAHEPPSVSTRNGAIGQGRPDLPSLQEQIANNSETNASIDPNAARQFRSGASKSAKPALRYSRHLAQLAALPAELVDQLDCIIKRAMAMKPADRYQTVADFSSDLKKVLMNLPSASQRPARPKDPNSTQPDLPLLYEEIQAAKRASDPATDDASKVGPPPAAPASQPTSLPLRCPVCNYELVRKAVYCPQCGSKLTDIADTSTPMPSSAELNKETNKASSGSQPQIQNPAMDQISNIASRGSVDASSTSSSKAAQAPIPSPATSKNPSGLASSSSREDLGASSTPTFSSKVPPTPFMVSMPSQVGAQQGSSSRFLTSGRPLKRLLFLAVILVLVMLLIALLVLLATSKGQTASQVQPGVEQQYSMQVVSYERNVTLCTASPTTPALTGIRACRSGISSPPEGAQRVVRQ